VVFAVLASLAVYRFVSATGSESARMPDTPESAQTYVCRECGHVFTLTPQARAELMARGGQVVREEMTAVRRALLPCPSCGAVQAVLARTCPICQSPYASTDRQGREHTKCPKCEAAERTTTGRHQTP
jgi:hypothetical protein